MQSLSCVRLCDPMDCSPPASSVHGIFQARILEWVDFSFSKGSSWSGIEPASPVWQAGSSPLSHLGSPDGFLLKSISQEPLLPLSLGEYGYMLIVVFLKKLAFEGCATSNTDLPPLMKWDMSTSWNTPKAWVWSQIVKEVWLASFLYVPVACKKVRGHAKTDFQKSWCTPCTHV